jgi:hypothetical protein
MRVTLFSLSSNSTMSTGMAHENLMCTVNPKTAPLLLLALLLFALPLLFVFQTLEPLAHTPKQARQANQ